MTDQRPDASSHTPPWQAAIARAVATGKVYGVCTQCKAAVEAGPYFVRRCLRHVRLFWHDHAAIQIFQPMAGERPQ